MLAMETEWKEWNYETKEKKNGQELVIGEIEIRIIWGGGSRDPRALG